jgi:hypothetical protein
LHKAALQGVHGIQLFAQLCGGLIVGVGGEGGEN